MNPTEPSVVSTLTYTPKLEAILHFLVDIFNRFKIKIDDKSALSVFINGNDLDGKLLRDYILANSPDEVSAEAYEAFKRSTLRNLVGLELMNSVDGSVSTSMYSVDAVAHSPLMDAKPKSEEPDPNADPTEETPEEDPNPPKKKPKKTAQPKQATTEQDEPPQGDETAESTQTPEEETEDQPMDQEDPKTTKKDKGVDDATQESDEPAKDEDKKSAGSGNSNTQQVHTHTLPKPKLPGINLKKGVTLELAQDDEDIDTFLYRKEVGSFIDSVLANPNHLSIQQQEMLRKIKSQFLYTLNVQSLYNLLKSTVS
jgi:hypothetical protein